MQYINLNIESNKKLPTYTHKIRIPLSRKVNGSLKEANGENCAILDIMPDGNAKVRTRTGATFQIPVKWLIGLHKIDKALLLPNECSCPWSMLIRGCECGSIG